MKTALVGYTGFVGSNIYATGNIDAVYNSKNIESSYNTSPDFLIYAGLRAEKYLANNAPEKDMALVDLAKENITRIKPKKLVLISTIDVFKIPKDVDENSIISTENLHAYGYNRYQLELWVRENYPDALIIRLPGLFGKNIKKNFIYDYITVIPFILTKTKFDELVAKDLTLKKYYQLQDNGFYQVSPSDSNNNELKKRFRAIGFSALNFTDSRSIYQFYNLERLWSDIKIALDAGILLLHTATEPISVSEVYEYLTEERFVNELASNPTIYNYKTIHAQLFNRTDGYLSSKGKILKEIKEFVKKCKK